MPIASSSLLSTVLAMAAAFLALSLLVQVIQECYKYLTSSRSRAYRGALIDFLGDKAKELLDSKALADLRARGPFQWRTGESKGRLQPMDKDDLLVALERTAATSIQEAAAALRLETSLQQGTSAPATPAFQAFQQQLATAPDSSASRASDVREFLKSWGIGTNPATPFDAGRLHLALKHQFLPSVVKAEESFTQLVKNFDHAYRRRNLRQTLIFGFLLAFVSEQPLGDVYRAARRVPLEQAVAAAEQVRAIYRDEAARDTTVDRTPDELKALAKSLTAQLTGGGSGGAAPLGRVDFARLWSHVRSPMYLLGCLLTALLIGFGAPFWNDVTGAVLRLYKGPPPEVPRE